MRVGSAHVFRPWGAIAYDTPGLLTLSNPVLYHGVHPLGYVCTSQFCYTGRNSFMPAFVARVFAFVVLWLCRVFSLNRRAVHHEQLLQHADHEPEHGRAASAGVCTGLELLSKAAATVAATSVASAVGQFAFSCTGNHCRLRCRLHATAAAAAAATATTSTADGGWFRTTARFRATRTAP